MEDESQELDPVQLNALKALIPKRHTLEGDQRAMIEELAKQHGLPLSAPPTKLQQIGQELQQGAKDAGEFLKPSALPVAGQMIFGATGAMTGNPLIQLAAQSVGGVIGTKANEMFGITEPNAFDYAMSGSAPGVGGVLAKSGRALLPGGEAAEQQIASRTMRKLPKRLPGGKAQANAAYEQLSDRPLRVDNLADTTVKLFATEKEMKKFGIGNAQIQRIVKGTAREILDNPDGLSIKTISQILKRHREKVASLEGKGGEQYGAYKVLRQAIFKDMDAAVARGKGQDVLVLRTAMQAAKNRIAKEELAGRSALERET